MSFEVLCAGLGRTGSLTLKKALEALDYSPCWHMEDMTGRASDGASFLTSWNALARGEPMDWRWLLADYQAGGGDPLCLYYRELLEVFPNAKVILTLRDPHDWALSIQNLYRVEFIPRVEAARSTGGAMRVWANTVQALVWDKIGDISDNSALTAYFAAHTQAVRNSVPADRLLTFVIGEDGWSSLCKFLHKPIPVVDFPHTNKRADMGYKVS